jgi:DNA-binding NtrC family response regulator
MITWRPTAFSGRHIVVADEDAAMVDLLVRTLREDGHAVFHAYDALSATQLALGLSLCDLVITNTKVVGADSIEVIEYLRSRLPALPIIYIANLGRSSAKVESQLPADVPILRDPFTTEDLRAMVARMLNGDS